MGRTRRSLRSTTGLSFHHLLRIIQLCSRHQHEARRAGLGELFMHKDYPLTIARLKLNQPISGIRGNSVTCRLPKLMKKAEWFYLMRSGAR
jgi:hypothetical protein